MKLNRSYFTFTVVLFIAEVLIGKYMHDSIIRPFGGDFLVVILLYCFVKTFIDIPPLPTALGVLFIAFAAETAQYFHLLNLLGWQNSKIAALLLGTSFSYTDLLCYTLGIGLVMAIEKINTRALKTQIIQ